MHVPQNPWPRTAACWLYDEIMRHVNPDLMLGRIPLLEKKYRDEAEEEHAARLREYERAFALYDRIYRDVADLCADEAHRIKERSHAQAMGREAVEKGSDMQNVEAKIDSFFSNK